MLASPAVHSLSFFFLVLGEARGGVGRRKERRCVW